jgi:hypothetical protein
MLPAPNLSAIATAHLTAGGQSKGIEFVAPQGCIQHQKQKQQQQQQDREQSVRSQLESLSSASVLQRYINPPLLLNNKYILLVCFRFCAPS